MRRIALMLRAVFVALLTWLPPLLAEADPPKSDSAGGVSSVGRVLTSDLVPLILLVVLVGIVVAVVLRIAPSHRD